MQPAGMALSSRFGFIRASISAGLAISSGGKSLPPSSSWCFTCGAAQHSFALQLEGLSPSCLCAFV